MTTRQARDIRRGIQRGQTLLLVLSEVGLVRYGENELVPDSLTQRAYYRTVYWDEWRDTRQKRV